MTSSYCYVMCRVRQELAGGAWCPAQLVNKDSFEYLEIDLSHLKVITLVETQGRFDNGQVRIDISLSLIAAFIIHLSVTQST